MDDLLGEFLTETMEGLETLDAELVDLEQRPDDPELIGNIFRVLHTIKGTSGFLDLPRLGSVAHYGENILGKFRDGELKVTPEAVGLILEAMDSIKDLVSCIADTGAEPDGDDSDLIARLVAGARGDFGAGEAATGSEEAAEADDAEALMAAAMAAESAGIEEAAAEEAAHDGRSTYDRIGGLSTIDAICDVMFRQVMSDERLRDIYAAGDIDIIQGVYREYLSEAAGGPSCSGSFTLADAFADLRAAGFTGDHFNASFAHFSLAMAELELSSDDMSDLAVAFEESCDLVLGSADLTAETATNDDGDVTDVSEPDIEMESPDQAQDAAAPVEDARDEDEQAVSDTKVLPPAVAQSLRVNVEVLENLMTMVSELVLTRNQLMQILRDGQKIDFEAPLQRLNQVTSELQEGVMQTRMQPIGNAWNKLPRIVRDIAHELGKKIELEMTGAETELDRQVLEQIKDPLTHMVRNSGDHGLETPAERAALGKPERGTIKLAARHEGGHIIIEISDDGRGIPVEKIRGKAIEKGLTTEAEVAGMTDQQILQFIFKPGFSTAEKVTNVSGRGVGMDVVRTNIAKIGGTVDLSSVEGQGSRFTIKIPLTLAIVQALIVESAGQRFAIPQNAVTELVRVTDASEHQIERVNEVSFLRLRNRLLPLVSLRAALKLDAEGAPEEHYVIVFQVGSFVFGVAVAQVFDTEEIVVKPVARNLRSLTLFSGNTILGDGSVVMILDPNGVANLAGNGSIDQAADSLMTPRDRVGADSSQMLLFRAGDRTPKAFPLELVARIEEIDAAQIEFANGGPVAQYRGGLMPLVPVEGAAPVDGSESRPVLVFSEGELSLGVVVDEIVDIVENRIEFERRSSTPGILGSTIINGHATDILDASHYLRQIGNDWFSANGNQTRNVARAGKRLLLIDDSPFFRNLLSPLLQSAGYLVTMADSADEAMVLLEKDHDFHAIISDIEMPGMNGLEFASTLRGSETWRDMHLFALSSYDAPLQIQRGLQAGFDEYIAKADHQNLIEALERLVDKDGDKVDTVAA